MEKRLKYEKIHDIHTQKGDSNVYLAQDGLGFVLRKEYVSLEKEQVELYHMIHAYLSKFVWEFVKREDQKLIVDWVEIEKVVVRVLPLDPSWVIMERPLDDQVWSDEVPVTYPEYIEWKCSLSTKIRFELW